MPRRHRWGSEQSRQVLQRTFSFLQLQDVAQIRLVSVAWWRASTAREVWVAIASSLGASCGFGIRDVEGVLRETVLLRMAERRKEQNGQQQQQQQQVSTTSSSTSSSQLPSWMPIVGGAVPSWVPQPPPRSSSSSQDHQQQQNNNNHAAITSDQIQMQHVLRRQRADGERLQQQQEQHHQHHNNNTHQSTSFSSSSIPSLRQQLDDVARTVMQRLHVAMDHHGALLPWQRHEVLDAQIEALRRRARRIVEDAGMCGGGGDGGGGGEDQQHLSSATTRDNNSRQEQNPNTISSRIALLERRQQDSLLLAQNTTHENNKVRGTIKTARMSFKVVELHSARRDLTREFERRVVSLCVKFSDASSSVVGCSALSTFFDLEMTCLAPTRVGSRLYTNWSSMKRTVPIDEIYFEVADVLLGSDTHAIENLVAEDEHDDDNNNHPEEDDDDDDENENSHRALSPFRSILNREDFVPLLRKCCMKSLERAALGSASNIKMETHSFIVDVMLGFVYDCDSCSKISDKSKNPFSVAAWQHVLGLVDRAKTFCVSS